MSGIHLESAKYKNAPFKVSHSLIRPSDTVPYSPGDAVTGNTTQTIMFTVAGVPEGAILTIQQAELMRDGTSADYFELWLFHTDVTANNDNDPFSLSDIDLDKGDGGIIDFTDARSSGNGLRYVTRLDPGNKIKISDGSRSFYGLLKSVSGNTPVSGEYYKIELKGVVG